MPERFFFNTFFFLPSLLLMILAVNPSGARAQLCNGSLGDPVVNITFGAGNNPGPKLSAATTNYQYFADPCPVNGFYTLLNKGVECNYGWHVLQSDHTGDPHGYCMLVDASFEPGDFYIDTAKNLCPNTTYEFAAWMLNMKYVSQGIRPNITFTIETITGQILTTYNSGDIPVEQAVIWKQYGFYFSTPVNMNANNIVLRMTNNVPGGDGNDLARACRIASNAVIINVHSKPKVDAGPDRNVIRGTAIVLMGQATGEGLIYAWAPDTDIDDIRKLSPMVSPVNDITYTLSATSLYGCTGEDKVLVKVVTGLYIPTAFTPNSDGINDTWKVPFLDPASEASVRIFNRFGQLVYSVESEIVSWDGMFHGIRQPSGTYVYVVTFRTNKLILKGTVTLVR